MLERVARALYDIKRSSLGGDLVPPFEALPRHVRDAWETNARAAVQALRRPTDPVRQALRHAPSGYPTGAWEDGIDAILDD